MADHPIRRPVLLVLDSNGYRRYLEGPAGVVFPRESFDVHLVSIGQPIPDSATAHLGSGIVVDDRDQVLDAARSIHQRVGALSAVVTVREQDLLLAALLREEFGVAGLSAEQTTRFRDKVAMKRHLDLAGIRVPRFAPFSPDVAHALLDEVSEVIVKPRAGAGSMGIHHVRTHDELRVLSATLRAADIEVEEFVPGVLHHVDSIVREGRVVAATVSRYLDATTSFATPNSYLRGISLPDGPEAAGLLAMNAAVLATHPYLTGVTHLELFRRPDGELVFCEVAARVGGGAIASSFHARSGVDLYAIHLRAQAGMPPPREVRLAPVMTGSLTFYAGPGVMSSAPRLSPQPWVVAPEVFQPENGVLETPADVSQAVVTTAVTGPDQATVRERLREVIAEIRTTMVIEPVA